MSSSSSILSRLHLETDHICRHSKAYRNTLPVQDRQDLQDTYSENVLFSAQAISAGFRIRGLDTSVEGLIQVAHELCQAVDILSCGLRERALFSIQQPYTDLFDKLKVFDIAWCRFEEKLCGLYATHLEKVKKLNENMQFFQILMNDAINLALDQNLISLQMLEECDNVLMVSIPRLAILIGVKENIDTNGPIDLLNLFEDASIEEIRVLLQNFSRHRYQILCRMIVDSNTEEMTDDLSIVEAFRFICGLADKLHSGKHAHFLADTLSRIFTQFQT